VGVTAWGLTLAQLFARAGSAVCLLARDQGEAAIVRRERTEPRRIADVRLPSVVRVTASPAQAMDGRTIAVLAVPSQTLRQNARRIAPFMLSLIHI
jgi:glycerol-3-phosphate dehydrogenase (NAD(P)+)